MKKVIVTGPNGFIGTALLKLLAENGINVIAVVKDMNEDISRIKHLPGIKIVYCNLENIKNLDILVPDRDIDACIHLAWGGSFDKARANYVLQLHNVKYSLDLVNTLSKMQVHRFVGVGTLAEKDVLNYHSTDGATPNAVSMYGIAKITAHYMTKTLCSELGIEHIWCMLSNTYGVGNTTNNFVNMASKLMLSGQRAAFTSGEQEYDFLYITDTVRGIYYATSKGKKNTNYYIGSTNSRPLKEYIKLIRDAINPKIELYLGEIPFKGVPLPKESYDTSKLVNDTGYTPLVSFEEGIKRTVDWLRDNYKPSMPKTEMAEKDVENHVETVVITGADGFVGSYTTDYFLKMGKAVYAIDVCDAPRRLKNHPLLTYIRCDISDKESLFEALKDKKVDTFIHFAWIGSAGPERTDYQLQMKNALNTVDVLKVAKAIGAQRFICAGSIMEYEVEAAVHSQGSRPGMAYIYGMGKQIAHSMCKSVAAEIGIDLIWPMITNTYGVGELSPRFVNTTLRKIIKGEPLSFTSATQNYDFIYISDVAKAFYQIATKGKPFCEYIIGSGNARPLKEFIMEMVNSCAPQSQVCFGDIPFTGTNMSLDVFNAHDLFTDCDFEPEVSFAEGTKQTMEWLKRIEEYGN